MLEDEKEQTLDSLPNPKGSTILVEMIPLLQAHKGVIQIAKDIMDRDNAASTKAKVLKMGPCCYQGERFKYMYGDCEPWCKVGDIVVIKRMGGTCIPGSLGKYQLLNDEQIQAAYRE